jgi:hypothetical protein
MSFDELELFKSLALQLEDPNALSQLLCSDALESATREIISQAQSVKSLNVGFAHDEESCCGSDSDVYSEIVKSDDGACEFERIDLLKDDVGDGSIKIHNVQNSIEKYKSFLEGLLKDIDGKIEECNFLYRQLLLDTTMFKKVLNLRTLFSLPPLIDLDGMQPPVNEDVKRFTEIKLSTPVFHEVKNWTKEELSALKDGAWNLSRILEIIKIFENFRSGLIKISAEEKERFEIELNQKIKITGYKCISNGQLQIDWDVLAKNFVPSRTGNECRIRWFAEEDPRINKADWTTEETKKLLEVAQKYACRNWIQICKELGTCRTPMQCFQRYQRSHNASIIKQEFSVDEDQMLLDLVPKYGFNWEQIAMHMPGRTASQCNHRYNNSAIQSIRSGRWSVEEDVRLILAKKAFDKWTYIADYVPGRTGMKCRERFANVLDPSSHRSKNRHWTEEEDQKLFQFVREHGAGNWSKIAELMGDRTDNQCYRRWKNTAPKYCPVELDEYKKKLNLKRKLVLNNFVGRKHNRPQIDIEALEEVLHSKSEYSMEDDEDFIADSNAIEIIDE